MQGRLFSVKTYLFLTLFLTGTPSLSSGGGPTAVQAFGWFESEKWDNQNARKQEFCSTTLNTYVDDNKICASYFLTPVRFETLIIDAAEACAVCALYSSPATCFSCAGTAMEEWFVNYADAFGQSVANMGQSIQELAGLWLDNVFSDLLDGGGWFYNDIGGWRIEGRAGVMQHCGRECNYFGCGPRTCFQYQPYIQIKSEKLSAGRYIEVQNSYHQDIWVAARYYDPLDESWKSGCYWHFSPNEKAYLGMDGGRLLTTASTIGLYAFAADGASWSGDGTYHRYCNGESIDFMRWTNTNGAGEFSINFIGGRRHLRLDQHNDTADPALEVVVPHQQMQGFVGNVTDDFESQDYVVQTRQPSCPKQKDGINGVGCDGHMYSHDEIVALYNEKTKFHAVTQNASHLVAFEVSMPAEAVDDNHVTEAPTEAPQMADEDTMNSTIQEESLAESVASSAFAYYSFWPAVLIGAMTTVTLPSFPSLLW